MSVKDFDSDTGLWGTGDYVFDILAGQAAGAKTVFISNNPKKQFLGIKSDAVITRLQEIETFI